jgi:hypothetical protein
MNVYSRRSNKEAWTIFEIFALIFVIYIPFLIGNTAAKHFGDWAGIGVGIISAVICIVVLFFFYRALDYRGEQQRREMLKKYPLIYRVLSLPSDCFLKAAGASIEVGDYGWEAEPIHKNGLIYLHGLNDTWQVVWYAGFRPDQIEIVESKPKSQYYVYPDWMSNSKKIERCPFPVKIFNPVKEYLKTHFGFPQKIHGTWVQGQRITL